MIISRHIQPLIVVFSLMLSVLLPWQAPAYAQAPEFSLSAVEKLELALDKRTEQTVHELKKDPARAFLLSLLYPGLGQLYVGDDLGRSFWIMGIGTTLIVGSIIGFGILGERPQEARNLGSIAIIAVLAGYHLWNVRDAYVVADEYNRKLKKDHLLSFLTRWQISTANNGLSLSYSHPL